ncbi:hypothetical protein A3K64_03080 [Candidatus Micrarchaeota archaeon RBG_16_36_9]|nr:MAG: hypothetical protein A3K64_03080 [Candidatus Micrarchaeota archaeon RBG_16_36_9]
MQFLKSLRESLEKRDYFSTCDAVRKFLELDLGYQQSKEYDTFLEGVENIPEQVHELLPLILKDQLESESQPVFGERFFHYYKPTEREGLVCKVTYRGKYPEGFKVIGLDFFGYGKKWNGNIFSSKQTFDESSKKVLLLPPDEYALTIIPIKKVIKEARCKD